MVHHVNSGTNWEEAFPQTASSKMHVFKVLLFLLPAISVRPQVKVITFFFFQNTFHASSVVPFQSVERIPNRFIAPDDWSNISALKYTFHSQTYKPNCWLVGWCSCSCESALSPSPMHVSLPCPTCHKWLHSSEFLLRILWLVQFFLTNTEARHYKEFLAACLGPV